VDIILCCGANGRAEGTVVYALAGRWIALGSPRRLQAVSLLSRAREAIALHPDIDAATAEEADTALAGFERTEGRFWEEI
jgi:hypothetical protein